MSYTDYWLKLPSKEVFDGLVPERGWTGVTLDPIGIIYRETGETTTDENGWPVPVVEPTEGYHVNVRVRDDVGLPPEMEPFAIERPAQPKREFA